ncbi:MAG: hypothetical protein RR816_15220 [Clostridia bacterium]
MRLLESTKQLITIKRPIPCVEGNAFEPVGIQARATVSPMSGTVAAQQYGLQPAVMRQMHCGGGTDVRLADGVCVDVAATDEPDFRVVYAAVWRGHIAVHLKYIPLDERGADV